MREEYDLGDGRSRSVGTVVLTTEGAEPTETEAGIGTGATTLEPEPKTSESEPKLAADFEAKIAAVVFFSGPITKSTSTSIFKLSTQSSFMAEAVENDAVGSDCCF